MPNSAAVAPQHLDLLAAIGSAMGWSMSLGRHVVVFGGDRQVGPAHARGRSGAVRRRPAARSPRARGGGRCRAGRARRARTARRGDPRPSGSACGLWHAGTPKYWDASLVLWNECKRCRRARQSGRGARARWRTAPRTSASCAPRPACPGDGPPARGRAPSARSRAPRRRNGRFALGLRAGDARSGRARPRTARRAGPRRWRSFATRPKRARQLYVRDGDHRVCIESLTSPHGLRTIVAVGAALLSMWFRRYVYLRGERARRRWVDRERRRTRGRVASVSAPVHDARGAVVAAISVSGPIERTTRHLDGATAPRSASGPLGRGGCRSGLNPDVSRRAPVGLAPRRQLVADEQADREAELFELAHVALERLRLPSEAFGEVRRTRPGSAGCMRVPGRPRSVRLARSRRWSSARDLGDILVGQRVGRRELVTRVGFVDRPEADAVHVRVRACRHHAHASTSTES